MNGIQRQLKQKLLYGHVLTNKVTELTPDAMFANRLNRLSYKQSRGEWASTKVPATNAGSRNSRPFIVLYEFLVCLFLFVFVSVALFTCYLFPSNRRRYAVFSPLKKGYIGKEKDRKANIFEIISPNI